MKCASPLTSVETFWLSSSGSKTNVISIVHFLSTVLARFLNSHTVISYCHKKYDVCKTALEEHPPVTLNVMF